MSIVTRWAVSFVLSHPIFDVPFYPDAIYEVDKRRQHCIAQSSVRAGRKDDCPFTLGRSALLGLQKAPNMSPMVRFVVDSSDAVGPESLAGLRKTPAFNELVCSSVKLSTREMQKLSKDNAIHDIESQLSAGGEEATLLTNRLRGALEAILQIADGSRTLAKMMLTKCPQLLLMEADELLHNFQDLRDEEALEGNEVEELVKKLPQVLTYSPAARERVVFFIGEVGLTVLQITRLAKRQPDILGPQIRESVSPAIEYLLQDVGVTHAALRRMLRSRPAIIAPYLEEDIVEKVVFFREELGLPDKSIVKIITTHPQVLCLDLDHSIRPVVNWLVTSDPTVGGRSKSCSQNRRSEESREVVYDGELSNSFPGLDEDVHYRGGYIARSGSARKMHTRGITQQDLEKFDVEYNGVDPVSLNLLDSLGSDGQYTWGLGLDDEGRRHVVSKQGDILWKSVGGNLAKAALWFIREIGLTWADLRKLVTRSPALLSMSVDNNLRPSLQFLIDELGMQPAKVKQIIVNQPSLLTLSVTENLRPKTAFFRDEFGASESDIAELMNQCPRVMTASVQGRILPRIQAMRAAGTSPSFSFLRVICTYPQNRFSSWLERLADPSHDKDSHVPVASQNSTSKDSQPSRHASTNEDTISAGTLETSPPKRSRHRSIARLRPSVRTHALAELGLKYTVRSRRKLIQIASRPPSQSSCDSYSLPSVASETARRPIDASTNVLHGVSTSVDTKHSISSHLSSVYEEEAFAPGRTAAKAVVRRLSRGLEVLDLYCGTGSFALNAAAGEARTVIGVDKRRRVISTATMNSKINRLRGTTVFIASDAQAFADQAIQKGLLWDLVIVDPPPLLTRKHCSVEDATNSFSSIVQIAACLARSGGMLMVLLSSRLFTGERELMDACAAAALKEGISLSLLESNADLPTLAGQLCQNTGGGSRSEAENDAPDTLERHEFPSELAPLWALFVSSAVPIASEIGKLASESLSE